MLSNKTHRNQSALAQFCRTGEYLPIDGVIEKNIAHYRRLVFNNVIDSLSSAYPITEKLLGDEKWEKLVHHFFKSHNIQSPQIWYMPKEFFEFVLSNEKELLSEYPFLANLLELEWLEIEVFMMPDINAACLESEELYQINPEHRLIRLDYPVHLKKAKEISIEDKGDYFIAIHRNAETKVVEFTNLSIPFVEILENLQENPLSKQGMLAILSKYANDEVVNNAFQVFINQAITNTLILKK